MNIEFCTSCRKVLEQKGQVIDHDSDYIFCSEDCISEFFSPVISYLALAKDINSSEVDDQTLELLTGSPDQVWENYVSHHFKLYTHILSLNSLAGDTQNYVLFCSYLDGSPSYILEFFPTSDLDRYQKGELVYEKNKDVEILDLVEGRKNEFLSELLSLRSELDIGFESFHLYQQYEEEVVSEYTESYADEENSGFGYFIKFINKESDQFYYIVYGHYETGTIHPVLSFPTIDQDYYQRIIKNQKLSL